MVGGKGNEKTTSDGQRVCASVGVFWFPPSQVSTSRGEVAAGRLPSWSRALSLGLPVRTALEFGGLQRASAPPTQGPYPPHTHSSTTHTRAVLPRSDPYPSRASGRAATPSRCRGSRWRLLALGSRPPDAAPQQPAVAPSLPAAAARLGRLASRPSSSAVSDWDGSPAAKRHAGAVLAEEEPRSPR